VKLNAGAPAATDDHTPQANTTASTAILDSHMI
jgi:hypothetical protein